MFALTEPALKADFPVTASLQPESFRQRSTLEAPSEAMQVGFGKLW